MQSPNRSKYMLAGYLSKYIKSLRNREFDAQEFETWALGQPKVIKKTLAHELRLLLLGFKAAGTIEKAGYRDGSKHTLPIVLWRVTQ